MIPRTAVPLAAAAALALAVVPPTTRAVAAPPAPAWASAAAAAAGAPAAPVTGDAASDPGAPGSFAVRTDAYRLAPLRIPGFAVPVEVAAEVVSPVGAPGARPLVMVLHGQHQTCTRPGWEPSPSQGVWPCPPGWRAVASHRGYRYLARALASRGDVVVSVSANGVNAQNDDSPALGAVERAVLLRHHLLRWARWAADGGDPWDGRMRGAVDMRRVVLVGHSRGGEGAVQLTARAGPGDPYRIRGLALIAPTDFGRMVTPGVPTMTLLPYCDGDVNDLQGQAYVDGRRDLTPDDGVLRTAVLALGANHDFFNVTWTGGPGGDDWRQGAPADDRVCGPRAPGRLRPAAQRDVAVAYVGALVRAAADDDPAAVAVLDGTGPRPASAGPARVMVTPIGGPMQIIHRPRSGATPPATGPVRVRVCPGVAGGPGEPCLSTSAERLPHWVPMFGGELLPPPVALEMRWRTAGGRVAVAAAAPAVPLDLTGWAALAARVAVDPDAGAPALRVRLTDAAGATALLDPVRQPVRLPGPPAQEAGIVPKIWGQEVRVPLGGAPVDLAAVTRVELVAASATGRVWVLDVRAASPGAGAAGEALPRIAVGRVSVDEPGDAGWRVVRVPLEVLDPVRAPATVRVQVSGPDGSRRASVLVLRPGTRSLSVPVRVRGDAVRRGTRTYAVVAVARRGAVVSRYDGAVLVRDDEPSPALQAASRAAVAGPGGALTWRLRITRPLGRDVSVSFAPVAMHPPPGARWRPMDTRDLAPGTAAAWLVPRDARPRPLTDTFASLDGTIEAGDTAVTLRLPLRRRAGGREVRVAWRVRADADPALAPAPLVLTGRVPAAR